VAEVCAVLIVVGAMLAGLAIGQLLLWLFVYLFWGW